MAQLPSRTLDRPSECTDFFTNVTLATTLQQGSNSMKTIALKILLSLGLALGSLGVAHTATTLPTSQYVPTSLSDAIDSYWHGLIEQGYVGTVKTLSANAVTYVFTNGGHRLEATFTQKDTGVVVDAVWTGTELVASTS